MRPAGCWLPTSRRLTHRSGRPTAVRRCTRPAPFALRQAGPVDRQWYRIGIAVLLHWTLHQRRPTFTSAPSTPDASVLGGRGVSRSATAHRHPFQQRACTSMSRYLVHWRQPLCRTSTACPAAAARAMAVAAPVPVLAVWSVIVTTAASVRQAVAGFQPRIHWRATQTGVIPQWHLPAPPRYHQMALLRTLNVWARHLDRRLPSRSNATPLPAPRSQPRQRFQPRPLAPTRTGSHCCIHRYWFDTRWRTRRVWCGGTTAAAAAVMAGDDLAPTQISCQPRRFHLHPTGISQ